MLWALMALALMAAPKETAPPPILAEGFEADKDGDGLPDGWFDLAGASLVPGSLEGQRALCLRAPRPGLPARARRAFPIPKNVRYLRLSFAFKGLDIRPGRLPPGLPGAALSLYDEAGRQVAEYFLPAPLGSAGWSSSAALFPVPVGARDALLTLGLFGAAGAAVFDAVLLEPAQRGPSENFVVNPDFSLGSTLPDGWEVVGGRRALHEGGTALLLDGPAVASQAVPFFGLAPERAVLEVEAEPPSRLEAPACDVSLSFRDYLGLPTGRGKRARIEGGRAELAADVPEGACGTVVRISVRQGRLVLRKVSLKLLDRSGKALRRPTEFVPPAGGIEAPLPLSIAKGSALDASDLLDPPAGKHGRAVVRGGHLDFEDGTPARFFGVAIRPPSIVPDPEEAAEMAELLSRLGVNLVKVALPLSPDVPFRCLLDPFAPLPTLSDFQLERFDRLVAELAKRGIYVAIELWGPALLGERFDPRLQPLAGLLPFFSPEARERQRQVVKALLTHKNTYRGRTYADDPAVAFLTLTRGPTPFALLSGLKLPEPLERQVDKEFNKWLLRRYKSRAGLARAWKHLTMTELKPDEDPLRGTVRRARGYEAIELVTTEPTGRLRDTVRFYAEVERRYFGEMASFVRGLGYRGLLSACSDPSTFLADLKECALLDIVEARAALSPTGLWSPVSATGFGDPLGTALTLALSRRISGRPYAVSWAEEGVTHSNPAEPAHLWLLTFLCAERGVDVLVREFLDAPEEGHVPTLNAVNTVPQLLCQLPLCARAFKRLWDGSPPKAIKVGEEDLTAGGSPLMFLDPVEILTGNFAFSFAPEGKGDLPKGRPPLPFVVARSPHAAVDVLRGRAFGQSEVTQFVGGMLGGAEFDLGAARFKSGLWLGTTALVSLDGRPLAQSRRLLFSCLGRLFLNGRARYADPFGLLVAHPGEPQRPPVVETAPFSFLLEGKKGEAEAFALSLDGRRRGKVEVERTAQGLVVKSKEPLVEVVLRPSGGATSSP